MTTTFDRLFFQNYKIFTFLLRNLNFSEVSFTFLYHFPLFFLINFGYFLVNSGKFQRFWKNQEIQDGGPNMAAILEPDVFATSYDVIS